MKFFYGIYLEEAEASFKFKGEKGGDISLHFDCLIYDSYVNFSFAEDPFLSFNISFILTVDKNKQHKVTPGFYHGVDFDKLSEFFGLNESELINCFHEIGCTLFHLIKNPNYDNNTIYEKSSRMKDFSSQFIDKYKGNIKINISLYDENLEIGDYDYETFI